MLTTAGKQQISTIELIKTENKMTQFHATTICLVRRSADDVAIAGDGQVTMGEHAIMKNNAKKIRKIYKNQVLCGFAGSVADAYSLMEKFEKKMEEHQGNLKRAAVALVQMWRQDQASRNLDAMMLVADKDNVLVISGTGEVIEPDASYVAIGSGGNYAYAAAHALYDHTDMTAAQIAEEALRIASDICVYTNSHISVETL